MLCVLIRWVRGIYLTLLCPTLKNMLWCLKERREISGSETKIKWKKICSRNCKNQKLKAKIICLLQAEEKRKKFFCFCLDSILWFNFEQTTMWPESNMFQSQNDLSQLQGLHIFSLFSLSILPYFCPVEFCLHITKQNLSFL